MMIRILTLMTNGVFFLVNIWDGHILSEGSEVWNSEHHTLLFLHSDDFLATICDFCASNHGGNVMVLPASTVHSCFFFCPFYGKFQPLLLRLHTATIYFNESIAASMSHASEVSQNKSTTINLCLCLWVLFGHLHWNHFYRELNTKSKPFPIFLGMPRWLRTTGLCNDGTISLVH